MISWYQKGHKTLPASEQKAEEFAQRKKQFVKDARYSTQFHLLNIEMNWNNFRYEYDPWVRNAGKPMEEAKEYYKEDGPGDESFCGVDLLPFRMMDYDNDVWVRQTKVDVYPAVYKCAYKSSKNSANGGKISRADFLGVYNEVRTDAGNFWF